MTTSSEVRVELPQSILIRCGLQRCQYWLVFRSGHHRQPWPGSSRVCQGGRGGNAGGTRASKQQGRCSSAAGRARRPYHPPIRTNAWHGRAWGGGARREIEPTAPSIVPPPVTVMLTTPSACSRLSSSGRTTGALASYGFAVQVAELEFGQPARHPTPAHPTSVVPRGARVDRQRDESARPAPRAGVDKSPAARRPRRLRCRRTLR